MAAPAGERSLAGDETVSGEQPAVSDNAARTPNRVEEDERIQASGVNGAKERGDRCSIPLNKASARGRRTDLAEYVSAG